jgi:hypothetical protein
MIYIKDDFLNEELLNLINSDTSDFEKVDTPGKSFWVKRASESFINYVCDNISTIEQSKIIPILGFFREAKEDQDNDWRIHNDSIIEGEQPDRACVLYLSDTKHDGLNGTAFWEHKKHGDRFENVSVKEQDRLLIEDSNDLDLWDLKSIIGHKKNRLISYPCNYFHSKYPNEFLDRRIVFVMFYKIEK